MPIYMYHMILIYINSFYDVRCRNSAKNNWPIFFISDQKCYFSDPELWSFLSCDTGVSHQLYETRQFRDSLVCFISTVIFNHPFGTAGYNRLNISCFHRYSKVFLWTRWCFITCFIPSVWVHHPMIHRCLKSSQLVGRCAGG